jgi:hypothetical protein
MLSSRWQTAATRALALAEITAICDSLQTIFRATRAQQMGAGAGIAERHKATA